MGSLLPTTVMMTSSSGGKDSGGPTAFQKFGSALFYAATSIFLVFVNKSVLTFHHFPAPTVLGIGQMISGNTIQPTQISTNRESRVIAISQSFTLTIVPNYSF